jgi:hypothetical protein
MLLRQALNEERAAAHDELALPTAPTRENILRLQDEMLALRAAAGLPVTPGNTDADCPVTHHFAPGLYAREIFLPAGFVVVGKIHRHAHINTISKGRVSVATEFGTTELQAPCTFVSQPGTKRVVVAHEDTIWTTYHPTDETDLGRIEAHVIAPTFADYDAQALLPGAKQGALACRGDG